MSVPSGKPILHFLHGTGFCSRAYTQLLQNLLADFDLFMSDISGHGVSTHGKRYLGWDGNAEVALLAFQAHRHLFADVPAFGVGHSYGGALTALMAHNRSHPFRACVLLDPMIATPLAISAFSVVKLLGLAKRTPLARAALRRQTRWESLATARNYFQIRGPYRHWHPEALTDFLHHAFCKTATGEVEMRLSRERETEMYCSAPDDLWATLRALQTPTRIICAKNGISIIPPAAHRASRVNPLISTEILEGRHCFPLEKPTDTATKLRETLRELQELNTGQPPDQTKMTDFV